MFTPNKDKKKSAFHDETLNSLRKVSRLVQKFESGGTDDETVDETEKEEQGEDVCDGPVFRKESFLKQSQNEEEEEKADVQENFDEQENAKNENDEVFYENENEAKELVETPILRSLSRQFSGLTIIKSHIKKDNLDVESRSPARRETRIMSRRKQESSVSSCSSESSHCSASSSLSKTEKPEPENSNFVNELYYCKLARSQVHHKFEGYFKWKSETLRSIAASVSQMRLDTLNSIIAPHDERVNVLKTIYENCKKGVNKEMDALCCALFDLLDDVDEKSLSIHEEYVAAKYHKKLQSQNC